SIYILQLADMKIIIDEEYQIETNRTITDTTNIAVQRGKIDDRNHKTMVDNKPLYSITYSPEKNVQAEKRLEVAEELAKYISMYTDKNKKQKIKTIDRKSVE